MAVLKRVKDRSEARRGFNWRVFVVDLLLWTAFIDVLSGIFLYTPGHFAHSLHVNPLGLTFRQWAVWHTIVGFVLTFAVLYHVVLNWRPLVAYIRQRARAVALRSEFLWALFLSAYLVVATVLYWPPVSTIWDFRTTLNGVWAYRVWKDDTVADLAKIRRLKVEQVLARFEKYGIEAAPDDKLAEVAKRSGYPVYDLYLIARGREPALRR